MLLIWRFNIENSLIYFKEGLYNFNEQLIDKNNVTINSYNGANVIFDGTKNIVNLQEPSLFSFKLLLHSIGAYLQHLILKSDD